MKQIKETPKMLIFEETKGERRIYYKQLKKDEKKEKIKLYDILGDTITFPFNGKVIEKIVVEGYKEVPKFMSSYGFGFDDKTLSSFIRTKFDTGDIDTVVITKEPSKVQKNKLFINVEELDQVVKGVRAEQNASTAAKKIVIGNYLSEKFPSLAFDFAAPTGNKELLIRNLNQKLIDKLTAEDIEKIGRFYVDAAAKYSKPALAKRMAINLQKNAQLLGLQEIVKKYEALLKKNPLEKEWQVFFDEYITLFDNRYSRKLDYKNIATGVTKYPDIVLVDIYGYIDFYELKRSSMQLLKKDPSHNTWYWSQDVSMVISQVADYLQKAKENSLSYSKAIKEATATEEFEGFEVNIIYPRAIIVAGSMKELNTPAKRHQFKNLRESLKDIEFILYDELLDRLKNLLESLKAADDKNPAPKAAKKTPKKAAKKK